MSQMQTEPGAKTSGVPPQAAETAPAEAEAVAPPSAAPAALPARFARYPK